MTLGIRAASQLPPWPYDTILAEQPLLLRPNAEGFLVGQKLAQLEEDPQVLENIGSAGLPFSFIIIAQATDRLILRNGHPDLVHTAQSIRAALHALAATRGPLVWLDPESVSRKVTIRDVSERQRSLAIPSYDVTLTLALYDPLQ